MFETREDVDPSYQPLPEEQPGGFNWGERVDGRPREELAGEGGHPEQNDHNQ